MSSADGDRERHRSSRRDRSRSRERSHRDRDGHRDRDRDRDRSHRDGGKSSRRRSAEKSASPGPRRRRRASGFDQAPAGGMASLSQMGYNVPGGDGAAPAAAPASDGFSSGFSSAAPPMMGVATGGVVQPPSQQATRHARRVYVGGLPPTANEQNIATFFSNALAAVGGTTAGPGLCVVNVYINYEKKFAFVEFRTVEETSNAMALDGIMFEGVTVRVRRPNDYNPAAASQLGPQVPNQTLNLGAIGLQPGAGMLGMADAADRVFVGGLPYFLVEEQCKELLSSFGPLKSFDLVRDRETGTSKGYGFVVFADPAVTDVACAGLNGMRMGERVLTVRRATESRPGDSFLGMGMTIPEDATRIIRMNEAVSVDELGNDDEYAEILEDMRDECNKHGDVIQITVPRPGQGGVPAPSGLGKVIVEFTEVTSAVKARNSMHGRKFAGRTVTVEYIAEGAYAAGMLD